jgi:hypothetical protein
LVLKRAEKNIKELEELEKAHKLVIIWKIRKNKLIFIFTSKNSFFLDNIYVF